MTSKSEQAALSRTGPRIGVAVLVWKGDELLLGKRAHTAAEGYWQFPGGHLEIGETVTECAQREVLEETGLQIINAKHAAFTDAIFRMAGHEYITLYVAANHQVGEPRVMEPDKCDCWQWFSFDALPEPLFEPIKLLLEQVDALDDLKTHTGS